MKKCFVLVFFIIIIMIFTGCKNKVNDRYDNNKDYNNQIINDDNEKDVIQSNDESNNTVIDNTNISNEISGNGGTLDNSNSNGVNNNTESKKEDNNSSSNLNNNTNFDKDSSDVLKLVEPTIEYSCDKMFDYKLKNGKCVVSETYNGFLSSDNPYTCPSGYVAKSGKCYVEKPPIEVRTCDNNDYILEGHLCLSGKSYDAGRTTMFYKPSEDSVSQSGISYSFIDQEDYVGFANIECFSNHLKAIDENTKTSYCYNYNGEVVKPASVTCEIGLKLINNNNIYQCSGIKYNYYFCKGKLVGTTCYSGKLVNYGMYCDDGSEIENGYCLYETNIKPVTNYTCFGSDKKVNDSNGLCLREFSTNPIVMYKCPSGYTLDYDNKCKIM